MTTKKLDKRHQQILERAIQKAIEGGWNGAKPVYDEAMRQWYTSDADGGYIVPSMIEIIYSHDFAKALFGEETLVGAADGEEKTFWAAWKLHLMRMVIAPDPIKYLAEHLQNDRTPLHLL